MIKLPASCEDPLSFGYNIEGGGVGLGGGWRQQHLVSKHNSTLILPCHTLLLRLTHSCLRRKAQLCHQALTLQIARQAEPNYNNHTNRATHRPTRLEGASQSCLIYDAPRMHDVSLLPNRLSVSAHCDLQPATR